MRRDIVIPKLVCDACNQILTDAELEAFLVYDGMCENCYSISMEAAYGEPSYIDDDFLDFPR